MKRNGDSADGNPVWERCTEPPVWLATEAELSADGYMSSMALCDGCRQLIEEEAQIPCLFKRIPKFQFRFRPAVRTA
jgi:hypothetical protein